MAKKYSGKFSPSGEVEATRAEVKAPANAFEGAKVNRASARPNFLFLAILPLLLTAFGEDAMGLLLDLAAFAVLAMGVFMLRQGLIAEAAYHERKVARRPALPRKIIAAILIGIGTFAAAFDGSAVFSPVIYGALTLILTILAFGIDPMRAKGMSGVNQAESDRVARAVTKAEDHLAAMTDAILRADDRQVERRVDDFAATARKMFRQVEDDPRDLRAARKFMGIYLAGAQDATEKFADIYARNQNPQARADYLALLDDLETNFDAKTETLLLDDRSNLDTRIEVLRERLQHEGLQAD
ncbi:MAG: 5-bromo-4-chloroindolyl phosphate hydrolysis family protein [Paracoccaceae bacterium]|nr:5-bromo-4-chloroindolyl phosphate hydrolysis family protein [Paracoccaceae bacterium]